MDAVGSIEPISEVFVCTETKSKNRITYDEGINFGPKIFTWIQFIVVSCICVVRICVIRYNIIRTCVFCFRIIFKVLLLVVVATE